MRTFLASVGLVLLLIAACSFGYQGDDLEPLSCGSDAECCALQWDDAYCSKLASDGRFAPCGVTTEDGVTEHLNAYQERC